MLGPRKAADPEFRPAATGFCCGGGKYAMVALDDRVIDGLLEPAWANRGVNTLRLMRICRVDLKRGEVPEWFPARPPPWVVCKHLRRLKKG